MPKSILHMRDIGNKDFWRVLRYVADSEDLRAQRRSLRETSCTLLLGDTTDPRLATAQQEITTALTDAGVSLTTLLPHQWPHEGDALREFAPKMDATAQYLITCGVPDDTFKALTATCTAPLLNGGNDAHDICTALGDIAFMLTRLPLLDSVRVAWVGGVTPLAHSLIHAAAYAPFELVLALSPWGEPAPKMLEQARAAGARIVITREARIALDNADVVYAGLAPAAIPDAPPRTNAPCALCLTPALMTKAKQRARLFWGADASQGCIDPALTASRIFDQWEIGRRLHRTHVLYVLCAALLLRSKHHPLS